PRTLHLDDATVEFFVDHIRNLKDRSADGPLFPSKNGKHINRSYFASRVFKPAVEAAGLSNDVTPHALRHTGATWLIESGASPMYAAKHLGHSNPVITMSTYADGLPDLDRTAMSLFAAWREGMKKVQTEDEAFLVTEATKDKAMNDSVERMRLATAEAAGRLLKAYEEAREEDPTVMITSVANDMFIGPIKPL
ncbi:MAG: tyrosine-type recombinase/integrase, partial [Actinomycetota bacterium]|nr:tyrosine-type recombinase/integrase [Actinomycetota bacterium]